MKVFISHSFENKPEYENIADALAQQSVPYWSPAEVRAGSSLRQQLREAVKDCRLCIFVATRHAIASSWCGAELGAFWGAGKPILVYLAEPSVTEDELPPIVQGDVWERRISRIVSRAKELLNTDSSARMDRSGQAESVTDLTVEQLERLIAGAVSMAAATQKSEGTSPSYDTVADAAAGAAGRVLAGVRATESFAGHQEDDWHNKIIWVDDRPENNTWERQALESMGFKFTLALSTDEALKILATRRFAVIISDMGRKEGSREGYVLLEAVRAEDPTTPFFIYAGSGAERHRREAASRGAQGSTNIPNELIDMVVSAVPEVPNG